MINWKTFAASLFLGVMLNASTFGVPEKIAKPLAAIGAIALGATAKDKDVTGTGMRATRCK